MSELVLLAALGRDYAIGRGNRLPWHLPADLARFKRLTLGHPILMGRKTAESLGRALPGRRNLVLSRSARVPFAGMEAVASLAEAEALATADGQALMVIGGGEIYALALGKATRMHLTWVDAATPDADTFFPRFNPAHWQETARELHPPAAGQPGFAFADYRRIVAAEPASGTE